MEKKQRRRLCEDLELYEEGIKQEKKEIFNRIVLNALHNLKLPQPITHCSKKIDLTKFPNFSDNSIGHLLGKKGNHKQEFTKITGINLELDKDTENTIVLSKYNGIEVEKAYRLIEKLFQKSNWSPAAMKKQYEIVKKEFTAHCIDEGSKVLKEILEYKEFSDYLAEVVGLLNYCFSYSQNMMQHSLEVAQMSGNIAAQLGLDVLMAKRAGFFHDVGKATANYNDHVEAGIKIAKKEKLEPYIINAIECHHGKVKANNPYAIIVKAMDKVSAGRICARPLQNEIVDKRKKMLEVGLLKIEWIERVVFKNSGNLIQIFVKTKGMDFNHEKVPEMKQAVRDAIIQSQENYKYNYEIELKVIYEDKFLIQDDLTKKDTK